ncbi:MAG: nucleotide exchange factor GrpE [Candidatus Shikimatogenerans bostrichidophilus]|nr:MAG: nucleotide exchange factor GrpE [Candidatus Shikimatogenerans bostrichidophilus]
MKKKNKKESNTKLDFKKKIKKYKNNLKNLKDKFIRILAEFDNYKKRNEKEKKNLFKFYIGKIFKNIIPILDDFDRFIKEEKIKNNNGIYLIYKKFFKILEENGLKKINVKIGDNFNPDFHYAISQIKTDKKMKKKIVNILENGYFVYDKIIRCTKVIVGN